MTKQDVLAARQDIRDAVEYYNPVREGLERRFFEQLVFTLDAIVVSRKHFK
jgi:hypothetical protein